jgi:hypothetical protein
MNFIMSRWSDMSSIMSTWMNFILNRWMNFILFWSISKHVKICQVLCLDYLICLEFYFEVLLNMLLFFSTLGQSWLPSIRSLRRGSPETATEDSLLPRASPLLLPRAARRWEALAAAAPILLLHPMTQVWRCGRCLFLLRHAWVTPPRPSWATTMNALTSKRWAHINCF